jgi:omega-hydroxy-beta-dihydromenaquinone-9 sulfotransferase
VRRYLRVYKVIGQTFGLWFRPLGAFVLLQLRQVISAITLGLDHVFYPGHRKQLIDRPIFIIGNPRSGTTFLHRLLLGAGDMAALELWEMLFPAITARKLLGGIVPRLDKLSPARYHPSDVHDTSLRGIETDDVAWFFRTMDGPFAWAYFLAWQDTWGSAFSRRNFGIDGVSDKEENRFFKYYEAIWRRNLILKKADRILVKSSMLTFRLDALLRRYPDCRLVYIVRDPVEVIPSGMSLLASVLENGFDVWNRTSKEDQDKWLENLYQASGDMLRVFRDAELAGRIPQKNVCVVRYEDLLQNLEPTMERILDFIEVKPCAEFEDEVRQQAEKQRGYTSRHEHSPDQFGLDPERIRAELGFVYDAYGLSSKPAHSAATAADVFNPSPESFRNHG